MTKSVVSGVEPSMPWPAPADRAEVASAASRWSPGAILAILRRRLWTVIGAVLLALTAAAIWLAVAPPRYAATAAVVADTQRGPASPTESAPEGLVDPTVVENQLETLRSDNVALAVIDRLDLWRDPEFVPEDEGLLNGLLTAAGIKPVAPPLTRETRRTIALDHFKRNMKVLRAGRSAIAEVTFTSLSPQRAADIANATGEAYLRDRIASKQQNAQRSSAWMQQRIEELRQQANASVRELEEFKSRSIGVTDSQSTLERLARIRELEVASQAYKTIYESFLSRYTQTLQEQVFPSSEARVVSTAQVPLGKISPKAGVALVLALAAGLTLGIAAAIVRELSDRIVRRPDQITAELGVPVLGALPRIRKRAWFRRGSAGSEPRGTLLHRALHDHPVFFRGYGAPEADALRRVKLAVDRRARPGLCQVVGVVSPSPGEGKTVLAFNLCAVAAESGQRTLLIDADLRGPQRASGPGGLGLPEVLANGVDLGAALIRHERGFDMIGEGGAALSRHPVDLLGSPAMRAFMEHCRRHYDFIVVDTTALLEFADAQAVTPLIDGFVLVAEHRRTTLDALDEALALSSDVADRLVGAVINKAGASVPAAEAPASRVIPFEGRPARAQAARPLEVETAP